MAYKRIELEILQKELPTDCNDVTSKAWIDFQAFHIPGESIQDIFAHLHRKRLMIGWV